MEPTQTFAIACASTAAALRGVGSRQLDEPTHLPGWDLHRLVNHTVGATSFFADLAEMGASPEDRDWPDYGAGDFSGVFAREAARAAGGFTSDGALDRVMTLPTGDDPGSVVIWVATGEVFVHGWDVAKATGQSTYLDARVADALLASVWMQRCDLVRDEDPPVFGPIIDVADGASPTDRLVAYLGRMP
jgi:uncharacterized protein (TIGR03086 family)